MKRSKNSLNESKTLFNAKLGSKSSILISYMASGEIPIPIFVDILVILVKNGPEIFRDGIHRMQYDIF